MHLAPADSAARRSGDPGTALRVPHTQAPLCRNPMHARDEAACFGSDGGIESAGGWREAGPGSSPRAKLEGAGLQLGQNLTQASGSLHRFVAGERRGSLARRESGVTNCPEWPLAAKGHPQPAQKHPLNCSRLIVVNLCKQSESSPLISSSWALGNTDNQIAFQLRGDQLTMEGYCPGKERRRRGSCFSSFIASWETHIPDWSARDRVPVPLLHPRRLQVMTSKGSCHTCGRC